MENVDKPRNIVYKGSADLVTEWVWIVLCFKSADYQWSYISSILLWSIQNIQDKWWCFLWTRLYLGFLEWKFHWSSWGFSAYFTITVKISLYFYNILMVTIIIMFPQRATLLLGDADGDAQITPPWWLSDLSSFYDEKVETFLFLIDGMLFMWFHCLWGVDFGKNKALKSVVRIHATHQLIVYYADGCHGTFLNL